MNGTTLGTTTTIEQRELIRRWSADEISAHQLSRVNRLLAEILPQNRFYAGLLEGIRLPIESLEGMSELPFTFKDQLTGNPDGTGFATNLTYPIDSYCRYHRTSGTRGKPLVVLDTASDWQWWIDSWQFVLDAAEIVPQDRVVMAFSFGPFIGFWSAFDSAIARGVLVAATGGLSTLARLELMRSFRATVVFCTPSYALHMAELGAENQINVGDLAVERLIVAGEPGGSIPTIRERIQSHWKARAIDHSGASEIGPWGFADRNGRGLYVNESEFIAEFISIEHGGPAGEGELAELVLTTLGRWGSPIIRYRTGDVVRPTWTDDQECQFVLLLGGVLGRTDDMMIVRGVNIFPSAIEQLLHGFPEIIEYRMTAYKKGEMDQLLIEIEDRLEKPQRVIDEMKVRLGLRVEVKCVPLGSLPRFELKGNRFVDKR
jgi:phenylacetate-CoA ligase